ncbi:carboxypeptidase-like regulatory domain-containing protein [uncultured Fibrobacter sp.]|uniref:carboxypeptidase-like regulatory domain-containing protein n=1 Tax=uncultured Fibrobacter sp. TaxID=261512 RepID=UPI002624B6CF|nr:carboxypeptidase-like regulatory domain-containing protein [uncultured Fibrobacter sp.]
MRSTPLFLYLSDVFRKNLNISRMVKTASSAALTLSLGWGLLACGETKTAGGGSSGSEAGNAITAQIMTADKKPAAQARVRLMDSESLDGADAYEAETDKKGYVTIEGVADGDYTFEAKLDGEALQLQVKVEGDSVVDLGQDQLKKMAKVSGNVGDESANGTVKVRGMEHSAKVENGSFSLDSLPEGALSLVFIPDAGHDTSSTYLKVVAGKKSTSSTFAEESRALLLDDFQDSNYQNRFMPARTYDGGWWYFDYSSKNVTPSFIVGKEHRFTLEDLDGNIVAHVEAEFGDAVEDSTGVHYPWATVGIELGKSDKALCNDISSVDSIAFRIRGKGAIVFAVIEAKPQLEKQKIIAQYEHAMSADWERVSVPLADIIAPNASYKCVNQLNWNFKATVLDPTVEFWLDDIELIGGDRLSIWEK